MSLNISICSFNRVIRLQGVQIQELQFKKNTKTSQPLRSAYMVQLYRNLKVDLKNTKDVKLL